MSTLDAADGVAGSPGGRAGSGAIESRRAPAAGLLLLGLLVLAVFVATAPSPDEDAYIGFVYAKSLLAGKGFTYNGIRVEGYTNPLTIVLTALVSRLTGLPVPSAGVLVSAFFSLSTVALFFLIFFRYLRARFPPFAASAVATAASGSMALNPYFMYWGFSGLENSLLSFAVLASIHARVVSRWRLSLLFAALLPLIRFDGVVPALIIVGFHCLTRLLSDQPPPSWLHIRENLPATAGTLGITMAPFLAGMAFRILYYGDLVPNTAYQKFLLRPLADRFPEGLAYCWNAIWASKSILYLVAIVALVGARRYKWDAVKGLIGLLILGALVHLTYIGGDVAWKPFFRFGHLLTCLVLLLFFLSFSHFRLALQSLHVGLVLLLTVLLQPGPWAPQVSYARELEKHYELRFTPPTKATAWRGLRPGDWWGQRSRRWYHGITHDFAEDPFAATGKYLGSIADESDVLVTSAAGKVVYYSGLRAIDTTGLADRTWSREASLEAQRALLNGARFLVFHRDDSACYFNAYLSPSTAFVPIAVVSDHRGWVWVFSNRDPGTQPESIGQTVIYARHELEIEGRPVSLYTDSFDPTADAEAVIREYARWSHCASQDQLNRSRRREAARLRRHDR